MVVHGLTKSGTCDHHTCDAVVHCAKEPNNKKENQRYISTQRSA